MQPEHAFPTFLPFIFKELLIFWEPISLFKNTRSPYCFPPQFFFFGGGAAEAAQEPKPGNVAAEIPKEEQPSQGHPLPVFLLPSGFGFVTRAVFAAHSRSVLQGMSHLPGKLHSQ